MTPQSEQRASQGDRFVAYAEARPAERVFIEVTRAAKDGSWADIFCCTWAVGWSKRQPLKDGTLSYASRQDWTQDDLDAQYVDWARRAAELAVSA